MGKKDTSKPVSERVQRFLDSLKERPVVKRRSSFTFNEVQPFALSEAELEERRQNFLKVNERRSRPYQEIKNEESEKDKLKKEELEKRKLERKQQKKKKLEEEKLLKNPVLETAVLSEQSDKKDGKKIGGKEFALPNVVEKENKNRKLTQQKSGSDQSKNVVPQQEVSESKDKKTAVKQESKKPVRAQKNSKPSSKSGGKKSLTVDDDFDDILLEFERENERQIEEYKKDVLPQILQKYSVPFDPVAGINSVKDNGATALHLACLAGEKKDVVDLIEMGANHKIVDKAGFGVFHYAAQIQDQESLVGAISVDGVTKEKVVSLDVKKYKAIATSLLAGGADPLVRDGMGFNVLNYVELTTNADDHPANAFFESIKKALLSDRAVAVRYEKEFVSSEQMVSIFQNRNIADNANRFAELCVSDEIFQNYQGNKTDQKRLDEIRKYLNAASADKDCLMSGVSLLSLFNLADKNQFVEERKQKLRSYYEECPKCPSRVVGWLENPELSLQDLCHQELRMLMVFAKDLVCDNANVTKAIEDGSRPPITFLHLALKAANFAVAKIIFDELSRQNEKSPVDFPWNLADEEGFGILHYCAMNRNTLSLEMTRTMLGLGVMEVDMMSVNHSKGVTPLSMALSYNNAEVAGMLLEKGADLSKVLPQHLLTVGFETKEILEAYNRMVVQPEREIKASSASPLQQKTKIRES